MLRSGHRVVFVRFAGGRPDDASVDVPTRFLNKGGDACSCPAGVSLDRAGALMTDNDAGNAVRRVRGTGSAAIRQHGNTATRERRAARSAKWTYSPVGNIGHTRCCEE